METVVAYGLAHHNPRGRYWAEEQAAERWSASCNKTVLLWLREGVTTAAGTMDQRHRLHMALFTIRARLADILWVPNRGVLGDDLTVAAVHAIVRARGGRLVLGSEIYEAPTDDAMTERVGRWVDILEGAAPRTEARPSDWASPNDVWADPTHYMSTLDIARLAVKLRTDLGATDQQIAVILERADVPRNADDDYYTAGGVNSLRKRNDLNLQRIYLQELLRQGISIKSLLGRPVLAAFGPHVESLQHSGELSGLRLAGEPLWLTVPGSQQSRSTHSGDRDPGPALVAMAQYLTAVVTSDAGMLLPDMDDEALVRAQLNYHGVRLLHQGSADPAAGEPPLLDLSDAGTIVRLHAFLRAHDQALVEDERLTHPAAAHLAHEMRARMVQRTYHHIAAEFNRQGIPTKEAGGQWWSSSVRSLLLQEEDQR